MVDTKMKLGLVQQRWHPDQNDHKRALAEGISEAAKKGAKVVCLQELTLSPYFCTRKDVDPTIFMEDVREGKTLAFISQEAKKNHVFITACSLKIWLQQQLQ
jgi:N-carbamoylputrescine amidase